MPRGLLLVALLCLPGTSWGQFAGDINRWTTQDGLNAPPQDAVLFIGSSSIRRWERLTREFADYEVIQRGFGGAQFDDVNTYVNDIVIPYQPRAIVIWAGTNDIAAGANGNEVYLDYLDFIGFVQQVLPQVEIFWLGIMPTPGRFANGPEEAIANGSIESFANTFPTLHYVDLPSAFFALNPPNDPQFTGKFVDSIHLNQDGYDLWASIVRPAVEAVVAPDKSTVVNPLTPAPGAGLLFDFGPSNSEDGDPTSSPDELGNYWNNWHPATGEIAINAGEQIGNLVDLDGVNTGVQLVITAGFLSNGKLNGGLLDADPNLLGPLGIDTATQDYFFCTGDGVQGGGNDDVAGGFMLRGLDPTNRYVLRMFGSRNTTANRSTRYTVTGRNERAQVLQTSGSNIGSDGAYDGNDDDWAEARNVRSDDFGQVFVDLLLVQGAFAYINALELQVYAPGDFDLDCDVDPDDAASILSGMNGPDVDAIIRDLDGDGDCDMDDILHLTSDVGSSCP